MGAILACPKCGSMVQVVPPAEWKRETERARAETETEASLALRQAAVPPPLPLPKIPPPPELLGGAAQTTAAAGEVAGAASPVAPAGMIWRKWLILVAAPVAAAVVAAGRLVDLVRQGPPGAGRAGGRSSGRFGPADQSGSNGRAAQSAGCRHVGPPLAAARRQFLVSLQPAKLGGEENFRRTLTLVEPAWDSSIGRVIGILD